MVNKPKPWQFIGYVKAWFMVVKFPPPYFTWQIIFSKKLYFAKTQISMGRLIPTTSLASNTLMITCLGSQSNVKELMTKENMNLFHLVIHKSKMKRGQIKVSEISLGRKNLINKRLSPLEVGRGPISKNQEKSSSYPWLISSYKHGSLKLHVNIKFKPILMF